MNDLAWSGAHRVPPPVAPEDGDRNALTYRARGAQMDVRILPLREGGKLTLAGSVIPREERDAPGAELTVELLDPLGVVATTETGREGEFLFEGLTSGVYHLRITGDDWKIGIFGLTA